MILRDKIVIVDKGNGSRQTLPAHVGWDKSLGYQASTESTGLQRQVSELTAVIHYRSSLESVDRARIGVEWRGKEYGIDAQPRTVMRGPDPHHLVLALRRLTG